MTGEAPKEMFVFPKKNWFDAGASTHKITAAGGKDVSYTLTTHALAIVAAEREAIAYEVCDFEQKDAEENDWADGAWLARRIGSAIRARTPADERAALDAMLKAERVKALRDAADCIGHITRAEDQDAILALIKKEIGHE